MPSMSIYVYRLCLVSILVGLVSLIIGVSCLVILITRGRSHG